MDRFKSFKDSCSFGLLANIENIPSFQNTTDAISALKRMTHRGSMSKDGKSGDGCGILFSLPKEFFKIEAKNLKIDLPKQYAIAMVFLQNEEQKRIIEEICHENDLKVILYRNVPINSKALGDEALKKMPKIVQIFVTPKSLIATKRFDALIYLARREIESALKDDEEFYIASFSDKLIVYKGLMMPSFIEEFYQDLSNPLFKTTFAIIHQRFSTDTTPSWSRAQPFRALAHNGEINSVNSNLFHATTKGKRIKSQIFTFGELKKLLPITHNRQSDSAMLDNMFEFLLLNGIDFFKAARSLIPAPWENAPHMDSSLRAFYEFTSASYEPWDGPAAVSLTDGRYVGCILDRNGLRPAKYIITKDSRIIVASEFGVIDIDEENILEHGSLQSGQMIGIDLKFGKVMKNEEINDYLKDSNPYTHWLNQNLVYLQEFVEIPFSKTSDYELENLHHLQRFFNITQEVKELIITPMAKDGKEGTGSMGDDTPLASFSKKQRTFMDFFKQKFAQVINSPIDPIREKIVMSLNVGFGEYRNVLKETPNHAKRIKTISPILMQEKFEILKSFGDESKPRYNQAYKNKAFSTLFKSDLKGSLEKLANSVVKAVKEEGVRVIFLDDRGVNEESLAMPMAMAVGRVSQALQKEDILHKASIVAITAEVFDAHSSACLIAYGASAIYPYLFYATVFNECKSDENSLFETKTFLKNSNHALGQGLLKILSKMGIATISSYKNSSLFDIIGLSKEIAKECFPNSHLLIPGLSYEDIEARLIENHKKAFLLDKVQKTFPLELGGFYKYLDGGEYHDFNPSVVHAVHLASITGKKEDYEKVKELINSRKERMVRDFLNIKSDRKPIDINEVEPVEEIWKRFSSAAMSLGSISPEAHEALAEAFNTMGAMSNSGEGGELPSRLKSFKNSKIKQIASGRFGVTPSYLRSAQEIQIKVAQGAKPGEGGQLPGHKVTPLIASLRYTTPGVTLISPPSHHDSSSIEDLAQLVFDLKQVNPEALIAVKIVSTAGIGAIAAGLVKSYADKIIISGSEGGTGAASQSSIKYAGNPWELGLSEVQRVLKANNLRQKVLLETDGGLKVGLDIVKAAMLGAEKFAFGTLALAIIGCKILRVCHLNRCSVGIATQDERLREHFVGTKERLINYFTLLAQDVREILATLGYTKLEDLIGRTDLLKTSNKKFDFSEILHYEEGINRWGKRVNKPFDNNEFEKEILKEVYKVIENSRENIVLHKDIKNSNRSFGALISGEIAKFYGNEGLPENSIRFILNGVAGQSLGAFLASGITIRLNGVTNDYLGKGMSGGKIVIVPKKQGAHYFSAGNSCLYGATNGKVFIAGSVGERFCVRNSGATAVVEGVGDHACEYMTGGIVVVLGKMGINFGAGMTGGIAFVYDKEHGFIDKLNQELVSAMRIDMDEADEARHFLKRLLLTHVNETKSLKAQYILENFRQEVRYFWMVRPKDMMKVPLKPEDGD